MRMRSCAICKALLEKIEILRFCPLSAVGSGRVAPTKRSKLRTKGSDKMAKIIAFYIPGSFRKNGKWTPPQNRGKIIDFVS